MVRIKKNKTTAAASVVGIARTILLNFILITCSLVQMIEKFLAKAMSSGLNSPATGQRMDAPDDESEFEQFKWLGKYTPCFEIDSANIEIMQTPAEFYDNLKVGRVVAIKAWKHREVV